MGLAVCLNLNLYAQLIGTYQSEKFLGLINKGLRNSLGKDYPKYKEFVEDCGRGEIEFRYGFMYEDVSISHVGGYESMVFVNEGLEVYVFWINSRIKIGDYMVYGPKPIPNAVLDIIVQEMNPVWGHVGHFYPIQSWGIKVD